MYHNPPYDTTFLCIFSYESDGKPAIRIIKPNVTDYQEIAFDTLTMRDFAKYKSTNYILAKIDDINNYFIVSPKGLSFTVQYIYGVF